MYLAGGRTCQQGGLRRGSSWAVGEILYFQRATQLCWATLLLSFLTWKPGKPFLFLKVSCVLGKESPQECDTQHLGGLCSPVADGFCYVLEVVVQLATGPSFEFLCFLLAVICQLRYIVKWGILKLSSCKYCHYLRQFKPSLLSLGKNRRFSN